MKKRNSTIDLLIFAFVVGFGSIILFPIWYPVYLITEWNKKRIRIKQKRLGNK